MKRYRFALDAVRDLRQEAENAAMQQLAAQPTAAAAARAASELSADRRARALERLRRPTGPGAWLVQADRDLEAARVRQETAAIDEREGDRRVGVARDGLVEARRALESITRLEARQREEHRRAALAEEERVISEIVEARAARAHGPGRRRRSAE